MSCLDGTTVDVAVVGGGQAGLSVAWYLKNLGLRHILIEQHQLASEWTRRRWDTFCLVTPNWQCRLPGHPYAGPDPDGFMDRSEIVDYLASYIALLDPPAAEGTRAERLWIGLDGGFRLRTSAGTVAAAQVVVATGPYQQPRIPAVAAAIPAGWSSLHSSQYRSPDSLPSGGVLVVGSGQSGCQIAEDLHLAGRRVHLAVGSAPRVARRYRGRDVVDWLDRMGHYQKTVDSHPKGEDVRDNVNHYVTGRDGGHDIDLRAFAVEGMRLHGRLVGASGGALRFADDLAQRLDHADAVAEGIKDAIDCYIEREGIDTPTEPRYVALWHPQEGPSAIDLASTQIRAVVWATGFRTDYSWIEAPVFDVASGRPRQRRGVTEVPGLYFVGLPWMHTWGSARLSGVAADAAWLSECIAARADAGRQRLARMAS